MRFVCRHFRLPLVTHYYRPNSGHNTTNRNRRKFVIRILNTLARNINFRRISSLLFLFLQRRSQRRTIGPLARVCLRMMNVYFVYLCLVAATITRTIASSTHKHTKQHFTNSFCSIRNGCSQHTVVATTRRSCAHAARTINDKATKGDERAQMLALYTIHLCTCFDRMRYALAQCYLSVLPTKWLRKRLVGQTFYSICDVPRYGFT